MTRTALTLELLAVLALACERQEAAPRREPDGDAVETAEPEIDNAALEHELDRLEREIKSGRPPAEATVHATNDAKVPEKAVSAPPKARGVRRNKSTNSGNKAEGKRIQNSGNGST